MIILCARKLDSVLIDTVEWMWSSSECSVLKEVNKRHYYFIHSKNKSNQIDVSYSLLPKSHFVFYIVRVRETPK